MTSDFKQLHLHFEIYFKWKHFPCWVRVSCMFVYTLYLNEILTLAQPSNPAISLSLDFESPKRRQRKRNENKRKTNERKIEWKRPVNFSAGPNSRGCLRMLMIDDKVFCMQNKPNYEMRNMNSISTLNDYYKIYCYHFNRSMKRHSKQTILLLSLNNSQAITHSYSAVSIWEILHVCLPTGSTFMQVLFIHFPSSSIFLFMLLFLHLVWFSFSLSNHLLGFTMKAECTFFTSKYILKKKFLKKLTHTERERAVKRLISLINETKCESKEKNNTWNEKIYARLSRCSTRNHCRW